MILVLQYAPPLAHADLLASTTALKPCKEAINLLTTGSCSNWPFKFLLVRESSAVVTLTPTRIHLAMAKVVAKGPFAVIQLYT
jgi:hypothetical protein